MLRHSFWPARTGILLLAAVCLASLFPYGARGFVDFVSYDAYSHGGYLDPRQLATSVPLVVTNHCRETIFPGILAQSGQGPGTGGFQLLPGKTRSMTVSEDWQGRVWGRTNCSFNSAGTAPSNGIPGVACSTGDCGGVVSCGGTGVTPVTLAEFTLDPGYGQSFYDISLVDGYNVPLAIALVSHGNSSLSSIPPNLTNPSCVASAGEAQAPGYNPYTATGGLFLGTTSSDPLPFEDQESIAQIGQWCPWDLQVQMSKSPTSGVYTYPDQKMLDRPLFDPCRSACDKTGAPQDCCTGNYNSPDTCQGGDYSKAAKAVCPDAYSYAFDDQTSTFIVPSGAGFEVVFCPGARSTNIIATSRPKLTQLSRQEHVKRSVYSKRHEKAPVQDHKSAVPQSSGSQKAIAVDRWILLLLVTTWSCAEAIALR